MNYTRYGNGAQPVNLQNAQHALDLLCQEIWMDGSNNAATISKEMYNHLNIIHENDNVKADIANLNLGIVNATALINTLIEYKKQNGANAIDEKAFIDSSLGQLTDTIDVIRETKARITSRNEKMMMNLPIVLKGISALQALFVPDKNADSNTKYMRILELFAKMGYDGTSPEIADMVNAITLMFGETRFSVTSMIMSLFNMAQLADVFQSIIGDNKSGYDKQNEVTRTLGAYASAFKHHLADNNFARPGVQAFADIVETSALQALANQGLIGQDITQYKSLNGAAYAAMSSDPWSNFIDTNASVGGGMLITGPAGVATYNNGVMNTNPTMNDINNLGGNNNMAVNYNNTNNPFIKNKPQQPQNQFNGYNQQQYVAQPQMQQNNVVNAWNAAPAQPMNNFMQQAQPMMGQQMQMQQQQMQQPINQGFMNQPFTQNNGYMNNNQMNFNNGYVTPQNQFNGFNPQPTYPNSMIQPQFNQFDQYKYMYGSNADGSAYKINGGYGVQQPMNQQNMNFNGFNGFVGSAAPVQPNYGFNNILAGATPINLGTAPERDVIGSAAANVGAINPAWYSK